VEEIHQFIREKKEADEKEKRSAKNKLLLQKTV